MSSSRIVSRHLPFTLPKKKFPGQSNYNQDYNYAREWSDNPEIRLQTNVVPFLIAHKCDEINQSSDSDTTLWFFLPKELFTIGATGFGQWNVKDYPNHCSHYSTMLEVFLFLAWLAREDDPIYTVLAIQLGIPANCDINNPIQNTNGFFFRLSKRNGRISFSQILLKYLEGNQAYEKKQMITASMAYSEANHEAFDDDEGETEGGGGGGRRKKRKTSSARITKRDSYSRPFETLTIERWNKLLGNILSVNTDPTADHAEEIRLVNTPMISPEKVLT